MNETEFEQAIKATALELRAEVEKRETGEASDENLGYYPTKAN